jgi:hypothetical protein
MVFPLLVRWPSLRSRDFSAACPLLHQLDVGEFQVLLNHGIHGA